MTAARAAGPECMCGWPVPGAIRYDGGGLHAGRPHIEQRVHRSGETDSAKRIR